MKPFSEVPSPLVFDVTARMSFRLPRASRTFPSASGLPLSRTGSNSPLSVLAFEARCLLVVHGVPSVSLWIVYGAEGRQWPEQTSFLYDAYVAVLQDALERKFPILSFQGNCEFFRLQHHFPRVAKNPTTHKVVPAFCLQTAFQYVGSGSRALRLCQVSLTSSTASSRQNSACHMRTRLNCFLIELPIA